MPRNDVLLQNVHGTIAIFVKSSKSSFMLLTYIMQSFEQNLMPVSEKIEKL